MEIDISKIPNDWCVEQLPSLDLVEAARYELGQVGLATNQIDHRLDQISPSFKAKWEGFVSSTAAGDQLWYFCSPSQTWQERSGVAGFLILRDGIILAALATSKS